MAKRMSTKKKVSIAAVGVLVVALVIGGAYAWTDYSQSVRNTFKRSVEADVLLHDDFNGKNKDVYVENTGKSQVFVRVKFAEYLQVGNDSVLDAYGTTTGVKADPNNEATWPIHQFKDASVNNECDLEDTHKYFTWNMSGAQKQYLAGVTEADGNGYAGLSKTEFDSYNVGDPVTLGDGITTYKRETVEASTIIMLSKWLDLVQGNYDDMSEDDKKLWDAAEVGCWLLDTDGWAYWSAPLKANTATNLLLDSVETSDEVPDDNWIYHIDVQMQAATRNEMDRWYLDGIADVANPDNNIATTTENGELFIKYKMGADVEYEYVQIDSTNIWEEFAVNIVGQKTPTGNYKLAGNDKVLGTDDDNMLAGRSLADKGGIEIGTIDVTNKTYTIKDASSDYVVTSGIDKKLGTYDDVITSKSGTLGIYEMDGNTSTTDYVGWNYLYGPLDNMLVVSEYVLDNVLYDNIADADGYKYADSLLKKKNEEIGEAMAITAKVNTVTLDMGEEQHRGDYITINGSITKYYTNTDPQADIANTKFFALSLNELLTAYGDGTGSDIKKLRLVQGALKWLDSSIDADTYGKNWNNRNFSDGDGNTISTTNWWLRSPGYTGSTVSYVDPYGGVNAHLTVVNGTVGARPACYLDLTSN